MLSLLQDNVIHARSQRRQGSRRPDASPGGHPEGRQPGAADQGDGPPETGQVWAVNCVTTGRQGRMLLSVPDDRKAADREPSVAAGRRITGTGFAYGRPGFRANLQRRPGCRTAGNGPGQSEQG